MAHEGRIQVTSMADREDDLLSVRDLVDRLAAELAHSADIADYCQAMSAGFFASGEPTDDMFERAQDLDLITQRMRAIGKVLHNLALDTNRDWEVDRSRMLRGVGLTEMTERIGGGACAMPANAPRTSSEIEMF